MWNNIFVMKLQSEQGRSTLSLTLASASLNAAFNIFFPTDVFIKKIFVIPKCLGG